MIASFYFVFEGNFQVQAPGGLQSEGRFNGGFFAVRVWAAYIWRGLFSELYGMLVAVIRPSSLPSAVFRSIGYHWLLY